MSQADSNVSGHVTTEAVSTVGSRTTTLLAVGQRRIEHSEVSNVLLLGAPMMFVVLAVTAMCCIILLRWKMQDRRRRRHYDNVSRDSTTHGPQQRSTEGTMRYDHSRTQTKTHDTR